LNKTLIIARHKEDVNWSDNVDDWDIHVIQKDQHLPNIGREQSSFIWYIIDNYSTLSGWYAFVQGIPTDHCPNIMKELEHVDNKVLASVMYTCDNFARMQDHIEMDSIFNSLFKGEAPKQYTFGAGGQFMVNAETIKKRSKQFYKNCYDLIMKQKINKVEYGFERLWETILGDKYDTK